MRSPPPSAKNGLLHARGGVSMKMGKVYIIRESSPRPWRCFYVGSIVLEIDSVFSTPVEVFPTVSATGEATSSLLHARGGVSPLRVFVYADRKSSPRPWRCFLLHDLLPRGPAVFSTPVEVFLSWRRAYTENGSLLHARGGVSTMALLKLTGRRSSPRPWRCFCQAVLLHSKTGVFSTPVEVFLGVITDYIVSVRLLHARGGVSSALYGAIWRAASSPRPWRCF